MPFRFFTKPSRKIFLLAASPLFLGTVFGQSSLVDREIARRQAAVEEGQVLLTKGDKAYNRKKYEEAVAAYAGARDSFPYAAGTKTLRDAAAQRYAQASVELAREMSRKGDVQGAKETMDRVLEDETASQDFAARAFRAELDGPIRVNPALTKEHTADVDEVRRGLYFAQGSYDLGKFDESKRHYEKVLRIDPYNRAARRGLERVASEKSSYYRSAYDHSRSVFLGQVESAWELPLSPDLEIPNLPNEVGGISDAGDFIPASNKLDRIIIPKFELQDATLKEAIELIRLHAEENDTLALDPRQKGVNVIANLGDPKVSPAREILAKTFDLNLSNVPLDQILTYVAEITGTNVRKSDFAVTFVPAGSDSAELMVRTYRVPPDFLSNISSGSSGEEEPEDVFNTDIGSRGVLTERIGAQEALELQGISFPSGASASLNGATNTLRVVNTTQNQDVIEQIVNAIALTEPVLVAVRVTMLQVQQDQLEELGFDWMLNNFQFAGDQLNLGGGTTGNGNAITDFATIPGTVGSTGPITAGNRSGDFAAPADSLQTLLGAGSSGAIGPSSRAPGIIGLNGVVGGTTIQSLFRGLNQKTGTDTMAQPSVTTRSGQAASIQIVEEFIYPTDYEPPQVPTNTGNGTSPVTPSTPSAFETRNVGVILDVLPVADANKQYVDVTITSEITNFDGFVNFGSPINSTTQTILGTQVQELTDNSILMPVFSPKRVNTNLVIADGATIVIGGVQKDEVTIVKDKTPILGDIPILGRFFQSNVTNNSSTAILFLINVQILDPTGRPYKDR